MPDTLKDDIFAPSQIYLWTFCAGKWEEEKNKCAYKVGTNGQKA